MAEQGLEARRATLDALYAVLWEKRQLSNVFHNHLPPADAARAKRLTAEVLRHLGRLDAVLRPHVPRRPNIAVQNILRLGAYEMLADGGSPHGVVDSAVTLAKRHPRTARASGLVNAVLRHVAEGDLTNWMAAPIHRLPVWLRKPLGKAYGHEAVLAIEAAHRAGAPIDLTPKNPGVNVPGTETLPTGSLRTSQGQVSALPGYDAGDWWVQDAASALPVRLFGDVQDLSVLDLCAAPGGKSLQLAAGGAEVVALDQSEERMVRLTQNLARTGLHVDRVIADALTWDGGPFDAVLLDAPCSASGTIRRHPDLPFVKTAAIVETLTKLQMQLIDKALTFLKPGGRLVYCTCSLLPNEGENQVKAALKRHQGLEIIPVDPVTLGGDADWSSPEGGLRLRPDFWADRGGMDGFYMALLQRR
ncbi:methyltransferase domain-containing protein [Rhodophyticola sp. CCM32]|uniref:RsmB/NOP family class I SAM-dependent RNA methyltransferase n=1 Tax=Rhodophyticola sp. CCM32 TaxID=2916397 RepID=UPI00107F00BB|nr:transcription antitermination factor NusB [Rhodophyticola sp. CCM32]QBY02198.1 methyltransferase domain-containing protein [Rhodophyticola sp. CCM32]